eukprot:scaffold23479_cov143-Cylindrotheca_fusiformis.AAC.29
MAIDWDMIQSKLPVEKTDEQKAKRQELFDGFDPNGNGYLSLAEVDKGCKDILGIPEIYENKPVMMRAFQASRKAANTDGSAPSHAPHGEDQGEDYIERSEFRLLLLYLRHYLEAWQMFDRVDSSDDRRIDLEEFKSAVPMIKKWGIKIEDPEAKFQEIDQNGGGHILFDEFADWALQKVLGVEVKKSSKNMSPKASPKRKAGDSSTKHSTSSPSIDWDKIREKLPMEKTEEQKKQRDKLFDGFDPNGNGILSLAEVHKGCKDILGLPEIYDIKPVMMRAFQAARRVDKREKNDPLSEDYIERCEFRLLLVYLRNYFEVWQMFDRIDSGDDRRIDFEEFKSAIPMMETWGVKIDDPEAAFREVDENGGGKILFDEFSDWAIKKGLDLEDDDD